MNILMAIEPVESVKIAVSTIFIEVILLTEVSGKLVENFAAKVCCRAK